MARGIFATGMGISAWWATGDWHCLATGPLWELCEFLPNGDYLGASNLWQDLEATGVGEGNVLLPCVCLFYLGHHNTAIALGICGALKGMIYWLANKIPSTLPNFRQGAELAELLQGLALGLGLIL